jgi:hypothetical protein
MADYIASLFIVEELSHGLSVRFDAASDTFWVVDACGILEGVSPLPEQEDLHFCYRMARSLARGWVRDADGGEVRSPNGFNVPAGLTRSGAGQVRA